MATCPWRNKIGLRDQHMPFPLPLLLVLDVLPHSLVVSTWNLQIRFWRNLEETRANSVRFDRISAVLHVDGILKRE